ncbi:MAG: hypothetical protein WC707_02830 [Candidatus Babeliaceae bacterium]|jgi:hypothetical protein
MKAYILLCSFLMLLVHQSLKAMVDTTAHPHVATCLCMQFKDIDPEVGYILKRHMLSKDKKRWPLYAHLNNHAPSVKKSN